MLPLKEWRAVNSGYLWKLEKAAYGLKEAGKIFCDSMRAYLVSMPNVVPSPHDMTLYSWYADKNDAKEMAESTQSGHWRNRSDRCRYDLEEELEEAFWKHRRGKGEVADGEDKPGSGKTEGGRRPRKMKKEESAERMYEAAQCAECNS